MSRTLARIQALSSSIAEPEGAGVDCREEDRVDTARGRTAERLVASPPWNCTNVDSNPRKLTCDWFSRAEFEKFVDDLIIRKIEVQEVVVEVSKKKHRGATKLSSVHGLDNGKRIVVQINELGQPVGEGGHSLKLFLGTISRLGDKMPIDAPTWRAMSATHKDDVWEYVQRKYDIPAYLKEWVMKDLDQKWRSWKYELRNKYFNPTLKQNEQQIPPDPRVNAEQWARVVQTWSSNSWKRYSDINKKSKSHHKYFHCAGTKSFADINEEETKLQEVKITQPSSSSSSSIASTDDIYSQVFGKERPGRVRGVGTGPTPTSLWGTSSQCQAQLRAVNAQLNAMVKELAERLGKVESIIVESKQVESTPNMERCVQSSASVIEPKGKESLMLDKKVKLCDMEGQPVANAIIMSLDKSKMVMGKSLGEEYYEVAILFAYKPNAPLFVKDNERKTVQDAVGSHIVWFRDFVELDET
ncbi:hypothetical protein Taro_031404 [Colocasia esculenta]|uniref:Transposase Tnp1/En/Spm-like domain-containing protein n=1 Tax=Colocasia esculenta TaxID=4460 RepID=A0A843VYY2_COLES|nr:hypothetical protein [Colocasia esculenta]